VKTTRSAIRLKKSRDYAEARIPEYWIVHPSDEKVTVLILSGDVYTTHGVFGRGTSATSPLLKGFAIEVSTLFEAH
jgi:Uma2 family endonuclease